ncbi:30S ribosomal protein S17 [Candidatus Giovannonibacteria bacterium]|nr:30S ribosomal protein S17 [Candidatus Giovannonibacteria bacterium]
MEKIKRPKTFKGKVVSDKMPKTRVVKIERYQKIPKYGKYVKMSKRFKAHDESNEYKVGDLVIIQETKPISRDKRWKIISKI